MHHLVGRGLVGFGTRPAWHERLDTEIFTSNGFDDKSHRLNGDDQSGRCIFPAASAGKNHDQGHEGRQKAEGKEFSEEKHAVWGKRVEVCGGAVGRNSR